MAQIPNEGTHDAFAHTLLHEYGLTKSHRARVIEEIDKIHNPMSFAHSHILMSLMGTQPSGRTHALAAYLEEHKTREPKHRQQARERRERHERERDFERRRNRHIDPFYD